VFAEFTLYGIVFRQYGENMQVIIVGGCQALDALYATPFPLLH
jgi:hypothetical protein